MAWNDTEIIRATRARIAEPISNRGYSDTEIRAWYNEELLELSREVKFLKEAYAYSLSDAVSPGSEFGTDLTYFKIPSGFIAFDPQFGVRVNGLSQWGTTEREVRGFEKKAQISEGNRTIYTDDYFNLEPNGAINHFGIDFAFKSQIDAGNPGGLFWFYNTPAAADSILVRCLIQHPAVASDTDTVYWPEHFKDVLILGTAVRAMENLNAASAGQFSGVVAMFENKYMKKRAEAEFFFDDANKIKPKRYIVKTARMHGRYNTKNMKRTNAWRNYT